MGFLAPWFLAGLLAAGVPVFVHLLRRQTTLPRPFSSLMFFEQGTQSSTRHRRLRYLVLFALRLALVLLLIFAFANPYMRHAGARTDGKLLIVVVDDSFSMRAGAGVAGSRLDAAKREALAVLAAKPASQRAQVLVLGGQLGVLTQPIQDGEALRHAVEGMAVTDARGTFGELGRGVRALLAVVHTPVELHLFSDMQRGDMPANFADMVLPGNVTLVLHRAGGGAAAPNWTVESVDAPSELQDPKDRRVSRVKAVIAGYGTPAAMRTVTLLVDGKVLSTQRVQVPADGRATVEFTPLDVPYGFSRGVVQIDVADAFPADDVAVFAVRRADPARVLFVHARNDARSPLYFGAALKAAASASFVLQSVAVEQTADLDPGKYAFVVLSDVLALPSAFEGALARWVQAGGNVLIAAGVASERRARLPIFGGSVGQAHGYMRGGGYLRAGLLDAAFGPFAEASGGSGSAADWTDAKFYFAAGIDPAGARVVARLTDGTPLLLEREVGEGHALLFASGFDNVTNDLPLQPAFVPFVDGVARRLAGTNRLSGSRVVGSYVQLRGAAAAHKGVVNTGVEVVDPAGQRPLSLSEAPTVQLLPLTRAGFYQVRYSDGHDAVIGVNADRRESDLRTIPEDVLRLWSGAQGAVPATDGRATVPAKTLQAQGFWWGVMLLALVAAVAESIAGSFYLGTRREDA